MRKSGKWRFCYRETLLFTRACPETDSDMWVERLFSDSGLEFPIWIVFLTAVLIFGGWNIVFPSEVSLDSEADAVLDDTSFIISSRSLPFVGLPVPPSSSSSDLDCSILSAFAACGLFDNSEPIDSSSVMMRYREQPQRRALTASSRPSSSMDRMNCPNR